MPERLGCTIGRIVLRTGDGALEGEFGLGPAAHEKLSPCKVALALQGGKGCGREETPMVRPQVREGRHDSWAQSRSQGVVFRGRWSRRALLRDAPSSTQCPGGMGWRHPLRLPRGGGKGLHFLSAANRCNAQPGRHAMHQLDCARCRRENEERRAQGRDVCGARHIRVAAHRMCALAQVGLTPRPLG